MISEGSKPENVAIAALVYSALTFVAMALYGVETWIERGEAFSVYFALFSRISPLERRDRVIGLRKPLSGLSSLRSLPGTVPLVALMIGSVSFDGASEAPLWTNIAPHVSDFFESIGVAPEHALEAAFFVGLVAAADHPRLLLARGGGRAQRGRRLQLASPGERVHPFARSDRIGTWPRTCLTLLLIQGQSIVFLDPYPKLGVLASDPLGDGSDLFAPPITPPTST